VIEGGNAQNVRHNFYLVTGSASVNKSRSHV
jgi:hypothetical protein